MLTWPQNTGNLITEDLSFKNVSREGCPVTHYRGLYLLARFISSQLL